MYRTLYSEWGKTWSVRAPGACLLLTGVVVAVTALSLANDVVLSAGDAKAPTAAGVPLVDVVAPALQFGQLVFAAFALQLIAAEYSTGSIRATLQAQPRRALVVLSKAVIAAACGALLGALLGAATGEGARLVLGDHEVPGQSLTALAIRAAALLALVGVLVVGLGALLRSAVGTLSAATVLLVGTLALPETAGRWTPGPAGAAVLDGAAGSYSPGVGALVLAVWSAAVLAAGVWVVERRDA